jgi:hypothetical protein
MKKPYRTLIVVGLLVTAQFLATSCGTTTVRGSGNIVTEPRTVSGFTALSFSGAGDLYITQEASESMSITIDDNLMEYVESSVQGSVLNIEFRDGVNLDPSNSIRYDIAVVELNNIIFSGAGSIQADSLNVVANTFDLSVSGVAECSIVGTVDQQNIAASGTLTYDAPDFQCTSATVDISGVGEITVWVSTFLDVTISGVGNVYYWGSPATDTEISGVGNVEKLGDK